MELKVTEVSRCLDKKMLIMGFEVPDLLFIFLTMSVLNFLFGTTNLKLLFVWLPSAAIALTIILLDHYIQSQWQSQIIDGKHHGKKLIEILKAPLQNEGKTFCANFALDVRKYPMISRSPILASKADLGLSRHY